MMSPIRRIFSESSLDPSRLNASIKEASQTTEDPGGRITRAGNDAHSFGKSEGSQRIRPHPWFPNPAEIEAWAQFAGEAAFMAVIEAELSRMQ